MRVLIAAWVLVLTGLIAAAPSDGAGRKGPEDPERAAQIERGKELYGVYCTNCHGAEGKGDGPTAAVLRVPPADLTRIAERNGGAFPLEAVRRTIDGRRGVRGHGRSGMPIWGLALQEWDQDTAQEQEVRERILELTRFVESIQAPDR